LADDAVRPRLTLCHDDLPPYATGPGEWVTEGIKYQLVQQIMQEAGLDFRVRLLPWLRCQLEATHGEVDGILPTFDTPERKKTYLFSEPVLLQENVFFYRKEQFPNGLNWSSFKDLHGLRLGMLRGGRIDDEMERALSQGSEIARAGNPKELLNLLYYKRVDLVAIDKYAGLHELQQFGIDSIQPDTHAISKRWASLAISRQTAAAYLLPRINAAIHQLRRKGVLCDPESAKPCEPALH